jgi:hypothetical protein
MTGTWTYHSILAAMGLCSGCILLIINAIITVSIDESSVEAVTIGEAYATDFCLQAALL